MQNANTIDNKYEIIRSLGYDGYSHMYLVKNINNNTQYEAMVRVKGKQNDFD